MKKIIFVSSVLSITSFSAFSQNAFTSSIDASYVNSDFVDQYSVAANYYFTAIDTSKGPLAEAVFLNRSNSVSASFNRAVIDFSNDSFSSNAWAVGGVYHVEQSGLFLNASMAHVNGSDAAVYGLGAGYYLANDWAVTVDTTFDDDLDYAGIGFGTKKLYDLGGDTHINVSANIFNPNEGDTTYSGGADYYFNNALSIGLGRAWADSFSEGATSISANWFVTDTASVSLEFVRADDDSNAEDTFAISASSRF